MFPLQKLPADIRATNKAVRAEELAARDWLIGDLEPLANPASARRASARRRHSLADGVRLLQQR
jgi:hypothetical protein